MTANGAGEGGRAADAPEGAAAGSGGDNDDAVVSVRPPSPLARIGAWSAAWWGPASSYQLTRWLILRLLGVVYVFAFVGLIAQGPALLGEHGLTPVPTYLGQLAAGGTTFWDLPSVLWWDASDAAMQVWAYVGLALSVAMVVGYTNLPALLILWVIYGSFVRVGQLWFSFGWELQLLETTLLAACLAHPWDPRPLRAPAPPRIAIVLMAWLAIRVMLGAGLIKLRGDACWTELTCLDAHFATQPIPSPLSAWFHDLPHALHAAGVVANHVVELGLPLLLLGPRLLRRIAGVGMAGFQVVLIVSGNLAFLNWLTLIPILVCFDDALLLRLVPRRARAWLRARLPASPTRDGKQLAIAFGAALLVVLLWTPVFGTASAPAQVGVGVVTLAAAIGLARWHRARITSVGARLDGWQLGVAAFAALVAVKSVDVIDNLAFADRQAMNRSYDRLALVNTYGAFGSVGATRHELIIEGTLDADPEHAQWHAYELPCKPGDLARRPCVLGPYHRRLDWLIWFAAMRDRPRDPWVIHLVHKLLDGDRAIRDLLAVDPFDGTPPRWVRIRRFRYHLQPLSAPTWWTRDDEQPWLRPVARDDAAMAEALGRYGWPSPSRR